MEVNDRRTEEEKETHYWLVTAIDRFMSGWGHAEGGTSRCAWACKPEDLDRVLDWVEDRDEMRYVNVYNEKERGAYRPRTGAHLSIYVVNKDHVSLKKTDFAH